jgi:outer membrane protein TolC
MRSAVLAAAFVLLAATRAAAQSNGEPKLLTLKEALTRVEAVGFDVRMARADAASTSADARSAGALLRPQIGLSANALDANEPQLGMPIARQVYGAATVSLPLFTSTNARNARAAREMVVAGQSAVLASANDAVYATILAYRKAQLAEAVFTARTISVADQETHLRLTEQRVEAGKVARYLTLRDRAGLAAAQQSREDAASERDRAKFDLQALIDMRLDPIALEPLTKLNFMDSREVVLARALRRNPGLLAAEERVASATIGRSAAQGAYSPTAVLSAQSYNGRSSPEVGRGGGQVQLTFAIPLVDGGSRAASVAKAQAQFERASAARDQTRANLTRDVASAFREFEAASSNLASASTVQADAQEQLRLALVRQNAGKAIEVEVLDALAVAANARESVVRSVSRYDMAIAALRHAAGDLNLQQSLN